MATTALGGVVSFGANLPVAAQDCGAPVDNMVRCSAAGSPYQDITYSGVADLGIEVEAGVEAKSLTLSGSGALTVEAGADTSFDVEGEATVGVSARSSDGAVKLLLDRVSSAGDAGRGVSIRGAGDASVSVGEVHSRGRSSRGIEVLSTGGDIRVDAGTVTHEGSEGGAAIYVAGPRYENDRSIVVKADLVRATSTRELTLGARGISVYGGNVDIEAGQATVSGFNAVAIEVSGAHAVNVAVDSIDVVGNQSRGVLIAASANAASIEKAKISVGEINVGQGALGIQVNAQTWGEDEYSIDIESGRITGAGAGISVRADGGIRVISDVIETQGAGIFLNPFDDAALVRSNRIVTTGEGAAGILSEGNGALTVEAVDIQTSGANASGMKIFSSEAQPLTLSSGRISTTGEGSTGVYLNGADGEERILGAVSVTIGELSTAGDLADGVFAHTAGQTNISAQRVSTSGAGSRGLKIDGSNQVIIESGTVETSGDDAVGVQVENAEEVRITSETIRTQGDWAHAVAVTDASRVHIGSDAIQTGGNNARGILVERGDIAEVFSDSIQTAGFDADGIVVGNVRSVTIESAEISTAGDASEALGVVGADDVRIKAGMITTEGEGSTGVRLFSVKEAEIELGSVRTSGGLASAVSIEGDAGAYRLAAEDLETSGANASAVGLAADGADYVLDLSEVSTTGQDAFGLVTSGSTARSIVLTAGSLQTEGSGAIGADLRAETMDLAIQSVRTAGDDATGLYVEAGREAVIGLGTVTTAGEGADGVVLAGPSGDYALKAGSVSTGGVSSRGVVLGGGENSRYAVELGEVTTEGEGAAAVTTSLDGLSHNSERIALKANALTTSGDNAIAAYLYAKTLDLTVSEIRTTGDGALAVFLNAYGQDDAQGDDLSLTGRFGSIATSGVDAEGLIVQNRGAMDIAVNSVETSGDNSGGLRIQSSGGGLLKVGSVKTRGVGATAVDLASDGFALDATFGAIETGGSNAVGLKLEAGESDSALTVGTLRTSGAGSHGIEAVTEGDLKITAQDIRVTGAGADGVAVRTDRDLRLVLGSVEAAGAEADAVRSEADGALHLSATGKLTAAHGDAVDLTGTTVDLDLASTAVVTGDTAGLRLNTEGGATISNAGSIASTSGYAIDVVNGRVSMANAGRVSGQIRLAGGDDEVSNSGLWTLSGESAFGGGADLFTNTGTIDLIAGATARTVRLSGLERLDNAGSISLANGVAGDVLSLAGELHGRGANTVALDLDLRGETALSDRIDAGAFSGLSHIVLDVQGDHKLGATSVVLARSGSVQTGAEIDVSVAGGGFVGYSLALDGNDYRLTAELSNPAFEPVKVASGAQQQWASGADTVSARLEQMRDDGDRSGRGAQVWGQAFNGSADIAQTRKFEIGETTIDADLSHEVRSRGLQAGMDREVEGGAGRLAYGLLASTGETELRFDNGDRTRFRGLGAGGYGQWTLGALALGGLAKFEHFDLEYDWAAAGLRARTDGHTFGVRLDAAWRADLTDTAFIEPQASLSWSQTSLGEIEAETGAVAYDDVRSLIGKIGLRAGANLSLGKDLMLRPYLAVHALNEFEGENAIAVHLASETVALRDEAPEGWGRATIGASVGGAVGLGGFVQAEQDFGSKEGFTARAGLRFAW